jgi:ankyrin repeat protein
MHLAIMHRHTDLVEALSNTRALDLNMTGEHHKTILQLLIYNTIFHTPNLLSLISRIIETNGVALNSQDDDGNSALTLACAHNLDAASRLLSIPDIDVNAAVTAYTSCKHYRHNSLSLLINKYFDLNNHMPDPAKQNALALIQILTTKPDIKLDERIQIHWGPDGLDHSANYADFTPLMLAAKFGANEVVQVLLQAGADPLLFDKTGNRAATIALDNGQSSTSNLINNFIAQKKQANQLFFARPNQPPPVNPGDPAPSAPPPDFKM